jgi:hypothetical protein
MTPREWITVLFVMAVLVLVVCYGGRWLDGIVTF